MSIDKGYVAALEACVDYWFKKHAQANARARYWAKMYDELTAIKNGELDDDDDDYYDD